MNQKMNLNPLIKLHIYKHSQNNKKDVRNSGKPLYERPLIFTHIYERKNPFNVMGFTSPDPQESTRLFIQP